MDKKSDPFPDASNDDFRAALAKAIQELPEQERLVMSMYYDNKLNLTDGATHRTMDLVERSGPLAERTARSAAAIVESWQQFRGRKIAETDTSAVGCACVSRMPARRRA
ncbi:MAG: hypothetical protein ABW110_22080 [Steroidobacteraceae bacterium]